MKHHRPEVLCVDDEEHQLIFTLLFVQRALLCRLSLKTQQKHQHNTSDTQRETHKDTHRIGQNSIHSSPGQTKTNLQTHTATCYTTDNNTHRENTQTDTLIAHISVMSPFKSARQFTHLQHVSETSAVRCHIQI